MSKQPLDYSNETARQTKRRQPVFKPTVTPLPEDVDNAITESVRAMPQGGDAQARYMAALMPVLEKLREEFGRGTSD